jgi:hypothetical protein
MNQQLYRWFHDGHAREALVGEGDFFCRCHTWGDHDTVLVLGQLFGWAAVNARESEAANAFIDALECHASTNRIAQAFRLVLTYFILARDSHEPLPIDMDRTHRILADLVRRQASLLSTDPQLRDLVLDVATRLPSLGDTLGLHIQGTSDTNVA